MTKATKYLATIAAALLLSGAASAQSLTTAQRELGRQIVAEKGVGFCAQNLRQRTGWSGGQVVTVKPVADSVDFVTRNGIPVAGEAVADACSDVGGTAQTAHPNGAPN